MEKSEDNNQHPNLPHQENSSAHHHHQNPKPETPTGSTRINSDRTRRDEWSEGAVSALLEAYEAKWTLRNRAKLKGHDWEEVAKHVSTRADGSKSAKTQTQCKNKVESMKKRYRLESAALDASSWPLYPRIDLLLRGNGGAAAKPQPPVVAVELASSPPPPPLPPPPAGVEPGSAAQNSQGWNGVDRSGQTAKKQGNGVNNGARLTIRESEKNKKPMDGIHSDSSSTTPAICSEQPNPKTKFPPKGKRRRREEHWALIGDSIRWMAEAVVRSEEARMETMKEMERMRAEAEARRGEMDLKRTEIIANTHLHIAKLFASHFQPSTN